MRTRFFLAVYRPQEIFNWLYIVESSDADIWEGGKLTWRVKYQYVQQQDQDSQDTDQEVSNATDSSRIRYRLGIKKDDVQTVLPISKVDMLKFF